MPNRDFALMMARYNLWQNDSVVRAADTLDTEARRADRGAFFGAIDRTLSHVLWADRMWLARFQGTPPPTISLAQSAAHIEDWDAFRADRAATDRHILDWTGALSDDWFSGDVRWHSAVMGREMTCPRVMAVTHLFNHQTHHRGQVHAMLTAAGARPDATDLPFMPDDYLAM